MSEHGEGRVGNPHRRGSGKDSDSPPDTCAETKKVLRGVLFGPKAFIEALTPSKDPDDLEKARKAMARIILSMPWFDSPSESPVKSGSKTKKARR